MKSGTSLRTRRARIVLAAVGLGLLAGQPTSARSVGGEFAAFGGDADSYAVGVGTKVSAVLPLQAEAFLTRTRAHIDSQPRSQGYAGVVDVPLGELLGLLGVPVTLPTYCYADFPGTEDNSCGIAPLDAGATNGLVGAGRSHASGDGDDPEASGGHGFVAATFLSTPVMNVGWATSESDVKINDGVVVSTTTTKLGQIDIAGVLKIDSIASSATAATGGDPGSAKPRGVFLVKGATVAGTPVRFTANGIEVGAPPKAPPVPGVGAVPVPDGGQQVPVPGPSEQLKPVLAALKGAGISVEPVVAPTLTAAADGTSAKAVVQGLSIVQLDPATGNGMQFRLGSATAASTATREGDGVTSDIGGDDNAVASGALGGGEASGSGAEGLGPVGLDVGGAPPTALGAGAGGGPGGSVSPVAAGAGAGETAAAPLQAAGAITPLSRRFRQVYSGGMLAALAVLVATGIAVFRKDSIFSSPLGRR